MNRAVNTVFSFWVINPMLSLVKESKKAQAEKCILTQAPLWQLHETCGNHQNGTVHNDMQIRVD